jgi:hypothetical protein
MIVRRGQLAKLQDISPLPWTPPHYPRIISLDKIIDKRLLWHLALEGEIHGLFG